MMKTLNKKLIFLDESGFYLNMTRHYARAFNGERAIEYTPFRDTTKYSVIGAIGLDEIKAIGYGNWNTDSSMFIAFIKELLLPKLNKSHAIIMDNVGFHKSQTVQKLITSTGATLIYQPPYSPEFNPVEHMWSKLKSIIRKLKPKTDKEFKIAIKEALERITPSNLKGWFSHCYKMATN